MLVPEIHVKIPVTFVQIVLPKKMVMGDISFLGEEFVVDVECFCGFKAF